MQNVNSIITPYDYSIEIAILSPISPKLSNLGLTSVCYKKSAILLLCNFVVLAGCHFKCFSLLSKAGPIMIGMLNLP